MAFTATQLQALQDALATGQLRVKYDGMETEYRSVDELKAAIAHVRSELEAEGAVAARKSVSFAAFCRD